MNYPFNQNAGELLGKRKYINRKLDEIKNKMIDLGWIQEDYTNEYIDEDEYSSGAILPYRQEVNDKLDFYESIINQYAYPINNDYVEPLQQTQYYNNNTKPTYYNNNNTKPTYQYQPQQLQPQPQPQTQPQTTKTQEEQFKMNFANAFGLSNK